MSVHADRPLGVRHVRGLAPDSRGLANRTRAIAQCGRQEQALRPRIHALAGDEQSAYHRKHSRAPARPLPTKAPDMRPDRKVSWLRDHFGRDHSDRDIDAFASLGDRFTVPAGRVLARAGDYGREAFVIIEGRVDVRRDGELVAVLGPGDVAGELAVTGAIRRNADLVTATDVELVVFDGASFRSAIHLSSALAEQVAEARRTRTRVA